MLLSFLVVLFLTVGNFIPVVSAETSAPTPPNISSPEQIGIPAGVQQGPSEAEIKQFENQFGAPPEAFSQPEIQKPQFEEPGKVPDGYRGARLEPFL